MKLIVGYHGKKNFGDDIILLEYLNINKDECYKLYTYSNIEAPSNIVKQYLWTDYKLLNIIKFIYVLTKVDEVVWVGGTCFSDQDGIGGYNYMNLAVKLGVPISYHYIGINQINDKYNKIKARKLLDSAQSLILRDKESFINLSKLVKCATDKVKIKSDLGSRYLKKLELISNTHRDDQLLVSWRDLSRYSNGKSVTDVLVRFIICNSFKFNRVIIIDADDVVDAEISKDIYNKLLGNVKVFYETRLNLDEKINLIKSSKWVITSRLHIAIAAYELGCQTSVYTYSDKIKYQCKESEYYLFCDENMENTLERLLNEE